MNLKDSEGHHRTTGSKKYVGSRPHHTAIAKTPTNMVVLDARTQQGMIDQFFSVPKSLRLTRMSERSFDLVTKIIRAVPKRFEGELQDVVVGSFMLSDGKVSEFQKLRQGEHYRLNSPQSMKRTECIR